MSFHITSSHDCRWRPGTWFECDDGGCQEVEVETVDNRMRVKKSVGLLYPHDQVMPYVTSVGKRGVRRYGG